VSEAKILEAARSGELDALRSLLAEGADVDAADEQGWTPLNYAAGRGDAEAVRLLLEHGADPTVTGRDNRTPLMIARAADRKEVVGILTEAEQERGAWEDPRTTRPYCKAYHLRDLRAFDGWSEAPAESGDGEELTEESIVYLHQDFTVTRSMWHGEEVVFDQVNEAWSQYCRGPLEFEIPEDLL
jgi:hypothetical protein